jgi:flagellar hook-basal body complex protein FliE
MTSPISGLSFPAFTSPVGGIGGVTGASGTAGTTAAGGPPSSSGSDFASALASSLDDLQATQSNADNLATQAATGNLRDVADYMIASNEASLATDTVVTLKNQAVSAFNEIMRMPV